MLFCLTWCDVLEIMGFHQPPKTALGQNFAPIFWRLKGILRRSLNRLPPLNTKRHNVPKNGRKLRIVLTICHGGYICPWILKTAQDGKPSLGSFLGYATVKTPQKARTKNHTQKTNTPRPRTADGGGFKTWLMLLITSLRKQKTTAKCRGFS